MGRPFGFLRWIWLTKPFLSMEASLAADLYAKRADCESTLARSWNLHTRFKGGSAASFKVYRDAADAYPRSLTESEQLGFWQKPFDWNPGHPQFFNNMYQILNGIQAMNLAPGSTVVEVGSGAGWGTEILACLKYRVICLEPAEVMLKIAEKRVLASLGLHRMPELVDNIMYYCTTLEEAEMIGDASADAIMFFQSFHHIIDENMALAQAFRILKPGAPLCILGDSNWVPGYEEQEKFWIEEMDRFGTLESPFTDEYLAYVLRNNGFTEIRRHHAVNQLVVVEDETKPVAEFVKDLDARYVNLFTAKRGEAPPKRATSLNSLHPKADGQSYAGRLGDFVATAAPAVRSMTSFVRRMLVRDR